MNADSRAVVSDVTRNPVNLARQTSISPAASCGAIRTADASPFRNPPLPCSAIYVLSDARMKKVTIHSDGACEGNPGPGGWSAVLEFGSAKKEISGAVAATTSNRMEITAAIEALSRLKEPCAVEFITDSQYLRNGITKWIAGWKAKGWLKTSRQPVKNADLWRRLDAVASGHRIACKWVKGHAGHAGNERCDSLAVEAIAQLRTQHTPRDLQAALHEFKASQNPVPAQEELLSDL